MKQLETAALFLPASPSRTAIPTQRPRKARARAETRPPLELRFIFGKCRSWIDAWAMSQSGASATLEGDLAVGVVLPDTVEIIDVPAYKNHGYVMLNDHRVLVNRGTGKVVRVHCPRAPLATTTLPSPPGGGSCFLPLA